MASSCSLGQDNPLATSEGGSLSPQRRPQAPAPGERKPKGACRVPSTLKHGHTHTPRFLQTHVHTHLDPHSYKHTQTPTNSHALAQGAPQRAGQWRGGAGLSRGVGWGWVGDAEVKRAEVFPFARGPGRGRGQSFPNSSENGAWGRARSAPGSPSGDSGFPGSQPLFRGGQSPPWQVTLSAWARQHLVMGNNVPEVFPQRGR